MSGPANDPASQSAIERFRDTYNRPAANANNGYFKVPNKTPQPAPTFEPPTPQKISENAVTRQARYDSGFTSGRSLSDNPEFRGSNGRSAPQLDMPSAPSIQNLPPTLKGLAPLLRGSGPGFGIGLGLTVLPGVLQQGPKYFDPSNPNGIFAPDPQYQQAKKALDAENEKLRNNADNALRKIGVPPWLNPFKNTSQNPNLKPPDIHLPPPLNPSGNYIYELIISGIDDGTNAPRSVTATAFSVSSAVSDTEREPSGYWVNIFVDGALLAFAVRPSFSVSSRRVPRDGTDPTNIVPESQQPFFPPHVPDWHGYDQASPPTVLDPNDFKPPSQRKPLSPMFPPELAPIPKPLDPIQPPEQPILPGPQPTKPTEEERKVPPLPFLPFLPAPNPSQTPPTFEPGPANPNQRLNDRGIFPSRQADITPTVSGSPLSPDVEIGGDPLRLKPAPKITKPKTPLEVEEEKKKEKKAISDVPILPFLPPIFPKPTSPTGTIDPVTADDITKSKEPPKPPVGTKPKCQDGCMAGLETGQQSILDKLSGSGINTTLNAGESLLLNTINEKMGPQLPGGLAGKLGRLSEWLHLDRALNLMTLATTLHNAYFLSSGLTQTLFSMISNVLAAGGIKDAEKNPLDISAILGKQVEAYATSVLGVTTVDGIKAEWKKYSRIYQAASNLLFSVQSIGQSILGALEMVGSMVAKIGNALQKWGVISEKAFGWMNTSPNYQNRFFTVIEKAEEVTSSIDSIASEVLSVQDTITQIGTQKKELEDATKQTEGSKQGKESPEATTVKTTLEKAKTDSQPPTIPVTAERKPEA